MTNGTATLRIRREPSSWRDRDRRYAVMFDDRRIGEVRNGLEFEAPIEAGAHSLQLRIDHTGSPKLRFEVEAGEMAEFVCAPTDEFLLLSVLKSIWRRDAWVNLRPA